MQSSKAASSEIAAASEEQKNLALIEMANALEISCKNILEANKTDIENARGKVSDVMLDRLLLTADRISGMAQGIRDVALLPDPVGTVIESHTHKNGLEIKKVSVPLGVIAIIYESRPNVTSDAAALAIKSGNACILRCGKEAHASAAAITDAMRRGLKKAGLPENTVLLIEDVSRDSANELMRGVGLVDLLIPRGGKGLISACVQNAIVPCIETGTGICHIYVDEFADTEKALNIIENAKKSRPSVCNAAEVCLINKKLLREFLPKLEERLQSGNNPVEIKADEECIKYLKNAAKANENDFDTEFLDYILAVKAVEDVYGAAEHIRLHSTHHSDAIITENAENAEIFTKLVDSAAVYVNASTRFTDGGEFGLGCEMGISTQKLHARGPMGLKELCTYKYIINGNGQIR